MRVEYAAFFSAFVGMVDDLSVIMIAVIVAVGAMMVPSKPLMAFVSRHPTAVIHCLGSLMMIGSALITEGFGFTVYAQAVPTTEQALITADA